MVYAHLLRIYNDGKMNSCFPNNEFPHFHTCDYLR